MLSKLNKRERDKALFISLSTLLESASLGECLWAMERSRVMENQLLAESVNLSIQSTHPPEPKVIHATDLTQSW